MRSFSSAWKRCRFWPVSVSYLGARSSRCQQARQSLGWQGRTRVHPKMKSALTAHLEVRGQREVRVASQADPLGVRVHVVHSIDPGIRVARYVARAVNP